MLIFKGVAGPPC